MTEKIKPGGNLDKIKIRIVAEGNIKDRSQYIYGMSSSPTVAAASIFELLL